MKELLHADLINERDQLTVACFFFPVTFSAISRSSLRTLIVSSRGEAGEGGSPGEGGGGNGGSPKDLNTASISSSKLGPKSNDFCEQNTKI